MVLRFIAKLFKSISGINGDVTGIESEDGVNAQKIVGAIDVSAEHHEADKAKRNGNHCSQIASTISPQVIKGELPEFDHKVIKPS